MATVAELEKRVGELEKSLQEAVRRLSSQSDTALTAVAGLRDEVSRELQRVISQINEALKKAAGQSVKTDRY